MDMTAHDQLVHGLCELTRLLWRLLLPLLCLLVLLVAALVLMVVGVRLWFGRSRDRRRARDPRPAVAFFHPYCTAGGGQERVLWCAVRALQNSYPDVHVVVYTGDLGVTSAQILEGCRRRFHIALPRPVQFVFLQSRFLVEPGLLPHFTLLGQTVGSVFLGWEAMMELVPDVYIDSMGYAFTLPLFRYLGGCAVVSYVHYPTISTDMLSVVQERNPRLNNADLISNSLFLSAVKLFYYCVLALLYGAAGSCSHLIMVNSSWTLDHILSLWRCPNRTCLVHPPCDVNAFSDIPIEEETEKTTHSIISVGQFRPEKDHRLQIRAFQRVLERWAGQELRMVMVGGCRNNDDEERVLLLRGLCQELGLGQKVQFKVNLTFNELKDEMRQATIGLHTMRNEHFGIGVVEMMAAGKVVLAHRSGGPQRDIVVPFEGEQTGFLSDDVDSFADTIERILALAPEDRRRIRESARRSVMRFSDQDFEVNFLNAMEPVMGTLDR